MASSISATSPMSFTDRLSTVLSEANEMTTISNIKDFGSNGLELLKRIGKTAISILAMIFSGIPASVGQEDCKEVFTKAFTCFKSNSGADYLMETGQSIKNFAVTKYNEYKAVESSSHEA